MYREITENGLLMNDKMFITFNDLAWSAHCFYYRSVGDRKYCRIMSDTSFIYRLQKTPFEITPSEFEQNVLLDYVNISSYDLLVEHKLAENILEKIVGLQPDVSALQDFTFLDCDFSNKATNESIIKIYGLLSSVPGIWITGVSKIAHLLNSRLLVMLNLDVSNHFGILENSTGIIEWLKIMQAHALAVTQDFHAQGLHGTPEEYLSEKLGYSKQGCRKPLAKYLDEYYWLRFADNLPIPPVWVPTDYALTIH